MRLFFRLVIAAALVAVCFGAPASMAGGLSSPMSTRSSSTWKISIVLLSRPLPARPGSCSCVGTCDEWPQEGCPMTTKLSFDIELPLVFSDAVARVKDALKQEGFGILTEIDLRAAFRDKLGRDFRPYLILGACNPPLAFSAISADPAVGSLLPCNVTVESIGDKRTLVRLTNPEALLATAALGTSPELAGVVRDASERMERVASSLNRSNGVVVPH
jgi:uncharacterized protein (DUF302 family)